MDEVTAADAIGEGARACTIVRGRERRTLKIVLCNVVNVRVRSQRE